MHSEQNITPESIQINREQLDAQLPKNEQPLSQASAADAGKYADSDLPLNPFDPNKWVAGLPSIDVVRALWAQRQRQK